MLHAGQMLKSRGEEAMEATLIKEVAEAIVETKEELIKELSSIDLALVGGGIANVSFF